MTLSPPSNPDAPPARLARVAGDPERISYRHNADSLAGRAVIAGIEAVSGRGSLIRKAMGYHDDMARGTSFWEAMRARYGLQFQFNGALDIIPREGPLVVVANHPYGILDGLALCWILSVARGDFQVLANSVFVQAPEVQRHILPVDFSESKEALRLNLETRRTAIDYLRQGGCVGVFPAGGVSTAAKPLRRAYDCEWGAFTGKLIQQTGATVLPLHFEGQNSRLFQVASHISSTLRLGLYINEFRRGIKKPLQVTIGNPLGPEALARFNRDRTAMMEYLRSHVYGLSPQPSPPEIGMRF